jgi:hypothetical protein
MRRKELSFSPESSKFLRNGISRPRTVWLIQLSVGEIISGTAQCRAYLNHPSERNHATEWQKIVQDGMKSGLFSRMDELRAEADLLAAQITRENAEHDEE